MSSPRVAIVMPAYNAIAYIGEAIESVRMQTFSDWELVVVDDGSTDDTAAVVERAGDSRVRLIRIAHSGLPAVARNHAISESDGEYVAFLDADDIWAPDKLARQIDVLDSRAKVGVVHCAARLVGGGDLPVPLAEQRGRSLVERLLEGNFIYNSSVVVRRTVLAEHGPLDTAVELRGSEDYELWLRLAPFVPFEFLPEPLLLYRAHGAGLSGDRPAMERTGLAARSKALANLPELGRDPRLLRTLGIARCIARMPGGGRRELLRSVLAAPGDRMTWKWFLLSLLGSGAVARLRGLRGTG